MPLADLQKALGALVTARAANCSAAEVFPSLDALQLTEAERAWLVQLVDAPGFAVTCDVQRWWRETKLQWTARLTLAALGPERSAEAIQTYLSTTPCVSLFFLPETINFLDFAQQTFADVPHIAPIARFEQALLKARMQASLAQDQAAASPDGEPEMTVVEFAAPAVELLGALLQGRALPPAGNEIFPVAVSASLPHFWQPLTE
jgi:hypothetical protein